MKNKNTKKSQETAIKILNCYLELLDKKPDGTISVSELCLKAKINRGTFYLHFESIKDVMEHLEANFFEEIKAQIEQVNVYSLDEKFFSAIINILTRNEGFSKWMSFDKNGNEFLKRFRGWIAEKFKTDFSEKYPESLNMNLEFLFSFIIGGTSDMLVNWFREGRKEDSEELAKALGRFANALIATTLTNSNEVKD